MLLIHPPYRSAESGFSLIELMISMLLGLLIVAGTIGLYSSLTSVAASKQGLDLAQETQRAVNSSILRMVRQADRVGPASNNDVLVLDYTMRDGMRDCRGNGPAEITTGESFSQRIYRSDSDQIMCDPEHGSPVVIADAITAFSIAYGSPADGLVLHESFNSLSTGAQAVRFFVEVSPDAVHPTSWSLTAALRPNQEAPS
ncbi:PilW family protein [Thioalkalivibrio sp. ALE16]|uniref:PilW family protein n=1 Tax=Thioalkalivibrio sp. ALE16 TaxID=1158172 RepID=UPI000375A1B1|nr:prepilin-type N-terminal cleavage/methylation domain-containing protein [Thioalkalivibrio sp. ALE16]